MSGVTAPAGAHSLTRRGETAMLLGATICAFAISISVFWIGFLGSDDSLYWQAAGNWLTVPHYLGTTHWELRHTVVIPLAISRALFGDGMFALLLPSLLYAVGFLIVTALWVRRTAGLAAAAMAMAIIVTDLQFIRLASIANVDVPEVFFIVSAFALIQNAMGHQSVRPAWPLLLLAGLSLGLAMLSRETSAFADVAILLLFLAGYGMPRWRYFIIGFGFAAVVGLEFIWLWHRSGVLFYRWSIALHHDATINRWVEQGGGIPVIHPLIDPLTLLLFNHNFGLLTWIGVPLTVWVLRRGALPAEARRLAVLTATLALCWTVIAAALWDQLPLTPRYFLLPDLMLSVVAGVALARLWQRGRRRLATILGVVAVGANLFAMAIDNRNYMYGEYELIDIAARHPGPIHTDPRSLRRAELPLEWRHLSDRVVTTPPGPGDEYYFNPARDDLKPGGDWVVVERDGLPPTIGQWLATHLLPAGMLPPRVFTLLGRGAPDVTLYRLPP